MFLLHLVAYARNYYLNIISMFFVFYPYHFFKLVSVSHNVVNLQPFTCRNGKETFSECLLEANYYALPIISCLILPIDL